jgi:hypothetical protein
MTEAEVLAGLPDPVRIWAVSAGDWSAYGVVSLFAREEDAVAFAGAGNGLSLEDQLWCVEVSDMVGDRRSEAMGSERWRTVQRALRTARGYFVESFDFYGPPA